MNQYVVFVISNEAIWTAAGAFIAMMFACLLLVAAARNT